MAGKKALWCFSPPFPHLLPSAVEVLKSVACVAQYGAPVLGR